LDDAARNIWQTLGGGGSPRRAAAAAALAALAEPLVLLACARSPLLPAASVGQGLKLVHFSAQPEPFLTPNTP